MIDPDAAAEKVTDDLIEDVLTDIETDLPQYSGALPSNKIAQEIAWRVVRAVVPELSDQALGYCHCLTPVLADHLEQGYCNVCGRTISLRIRRTA